MYLKVPHIKEGASNPRQATVAEVEAAIERFAPGEGLMVDEALRHPSIEFPDGFSYPRYEQIRDWLISQGFEVS